MKIGIVGSGIAGIAAAHRLARVAEVTLFEAEGRLGGHTDSHSVYIDGRVFALDTGFIAFNTENYPRFASWLGQIGVPSQRTTMSFSVTADQEDVEYATGSLSSLFAATKLMFSFGHLRMLWDIRRFYILAAKLSDQGISGEAISIGEFLEQQCFSKRFKLFYMAPLCAALWTHSNTDPLEIPLQHVVSFLRYHDMLKLEGQPLWRVISGGSSQYLEAFEKQFLGNIRLNKAVRKVIRQSDGVILETDTDADKYDAVILACHSDQALSMLDSPTDEEQGILGAIRYGENRIVLHSDETFMPKRKSAWASWNARVIDDTGRSVTTYWMNKLQAMNGPQFFITLNPERRPEHVWTERSYSHPIFDKKAHEAKSRHDLVDGVGHVFYCGSYWGWGFHEDGFTSGMSAAEKVIDRYIGTDQDAERAEATLLGTLSQRLGG